MVFVNSNRKFSAGKIVKEISCDIKIEKTKLNPSKIKGASADGKMTNWAGPRKG